jgi:hypothetical protein
MALSKNQLKYRKYVKYIKNLNIFAINSVLLSFLVFDKPQSHILYAAQ